MMSQEIRKRPKRIAASSGFAVLLILISIGYGYAAYRVQRPITDTGGVINQTYLWAEDGHRGVDFSYGLGTDVHAVASGTVVDLEESLQNGEDDSDWGNFVLIRHDQFHYDRTYGASGTLAHVYSMYLHLSRNSVRVAEGNHVNAGDWIAEVDDTGAHSSGHHLHLQLVLHPYPDKTLDPFTLDSENRSRNPELWLAPFNYGDDQTGTIIGRISDSNGNPVANLQIHGFEKPSAAGGTVYEWSQTYSYDWANPDDIRADNFGTTDVAPGTYHIVAKHYSGGQWVDYRDLGWHTVEAGKRTYVGLYPVSLPDVRADHEGWNSTIVIRNNSTTRSAEANITLFWPDGLAWQGDTTTVVSNATFNYTPPSLDTVLSPVVAVSEDATAIVRNRRYNELTIYNGIRGSGGSPGWEQAGSTLYVPVVKYNRYGRSGSIDVVNVGSAASDVYAYFYECAPPCGNGAYKGYLRVTDLAPNARTTFNAANKCPSNRVCAVRVVSSAGQSLAAVVREYNHNGGGAPTTYNAFASASGTNYVSLYKYDRYGENSGIAVMNTNGTYSANVSITFYDALDADVYYANGSVPPNSVKTWVGNVPAGFVGSAVVVSTRPVVAAVYEEGNGNYKAADAFLSGASTLYVPELRTTSGYAAGLSIQNASGDTTAICLISYFDIDGDSAGTRGPYTIPVGETRLLNNYNGGIPSDFYGSARIQTNGGVPVVATVNWEQSGGGDTHATYSASQP
jgi:hypothetical protein